MDARLTFRDKCPTVCWQKQLRDKFLSLGTPPVETLDLRSAMVRPITRRTAEQVILRYEWLGTLPPSARDHYGIFFGMFCAGVTCVGWGGGGANINAFMEFGLSSQYELAYLMRGACVHWAPPGTNSKLISWTCRLLKSDSPCKAVIAYSDTDAGEIGTVYQASNWACIGRGSATTQYVSPEGRVMDQKLIHDMKRRSGHSRSDCRSRLLLAGWREQKSNAKFRYVYVLDRADKRLMGKVESMRQPYPKRAGSIASDAPAVQAGEGGSTPTPALQTSSSTG